MKAKRKSNKAVFSMLEAHCLIHIFANEFTLLPYKHIHSSAAASTAAAAASSTRGVIRWDI